MAKRKTTKEIVKEEVAEQLKGIEPPKVDNTINIKQPETGKVQAVFELARAVQDLAKVLQGPTVEISNNKFVNGSVRVNIEE